MSRLALPLLVLACATLTAQAPPRDRPRPGSDARIRRVATGNASIRGLVVSANSDDVLRHAIVSVSSVGLDIPATLSDENGVFAFTALPAGNYVVNVTKPGYVKQTRTVALKDDVSRADVRMAMTKGGVISGTIVDEFGDPVLGMPVAIMRAPAAGSDPRRQGPPVATLTPDEFGNYRVASLAAGSYLVYVRVVTPLVIVNGVTRAQPSLSQIYFPGASELSGAQAIIIQSGEERTGISFTVPRRDQRSPFAPPENQKPQAVIRGRITRLEGGAASGATITARLDGTARPITGAVTDSNGMYELSLMSVSPGDRVRIFASKPGYFATQFEQRSPTTSGVAIPVEPGASIDHIDIALSRLGTISGRIVDDLGEPVEGALVHPVVLRYVNGRRQLVDAGATRRTDDLGRYRLPSLTPNDYSVAVAVGQVAGGMAAADIPGYATTYFPGTSNVAEVQFVHVEPGQEITADFSLARSNAFRITGTATNANGEPVTGGIALMTTERSGSPTGVELGARIDQDGHFEFRNVAPGDYVLQVARRNGNPFDEGQFAYEYITLVDKDVTDLEIQTSIGSSLSGRVIVDSGGSLALDQVEISAMPVDVDRAPRIGGPPGRARVNADGTFTLSGISGDRRLQLVRAPQGWTLRTVLAHGMDVTDQPIAFGRDDQSIDDIQIVLTNRVTRITGTVSTPTNVSPGDLAVLAFAADRETWYQGTRYRKRVTPTSAGIYTIEGLPPGDYYLVAAPPPRDAGEWLAPAVLDRLVPNATRVRVADGEQVSAPLRSSAR